MLSSSGGCGFASWVPGGGFPLNPLAGDCRCAVRTYVVHSFLPGFVPFRGVVCCCLGPDLVPNHHRVWHLGPIRCVVGGFCPVWRADQRCGACVVGCLSP